MNVYKTPHDAAALAAKRMTHRFWQDRVCDMIRHCCLISAKDGSTPIAMHKVRVDRVAANWPRSGSIRVTRDDGKQFRLHMVSNQFKVEAI